MNAGVLLLHSLALFYVTFRQSEFCIGYSEQDASRSGEESLMVMLLPSLRTGLFHRNTHRLMKLHFCGGYKQEPKKIVMGGTLDGRATHQMRFQLLRILVRSYASGKETATVKTETGWYQLWSLSSRMSIQASFLCSTQIYERHDGVT